MIELRNTLSRQGLDGAKLSAVRNNQRPGSAAKGERVHCRRAEFRNIEACHRSDVQARSWKRTASWRATSRWKNRRDGLGIFAPRELTFHTTPRQRGPPKMEPRHCRGPRCERVRLGRLRSHRDSRSRGLPRKRHRRARRRALRRQPRIRRRPAHRARGRPSRVMDCSGGLRLLLALRRLC